MTEFVPEGQQPKRKTTPYAGAASQYAPPPLPKNPGNRPTATAPWTKMNQGGSQFLVDPEIESGLALQPLNSDWIWDRGEGALGGPGGGGQPPYTTNPPAPTTPGATPAVPGAIGPPGDVGWVNLRRNAPDYKGILGKYTQDWEARLGAGLAAMKAQRLSRARGAINRLGVRNPAALLPKLQQYGLTEEDLRLAQENPWSELKAIEQQTADARGQSQAEFAARGGFRSGGTARSMERIEDARARNEAMATEETLGGLAQDEFDAAQWEQQQRDELDQRAANMEMQLAQIYQPYDVQAYWDPNAQGYRYGEEVYDQYGNRIR